LIVPPKEWQENNHQTHYYLLGCLTILVIGVDLIYSLALSAQETTPVDRMAELRETIVFCYFLAILLQVLVIIEQHKFHVPWDIEDLCLAIVFLSVSFLKTFLESFLRPMNVFLLFFSFLFLLRSIHLLTTYFHHHFHHSHHPFRSSTSFM
jgi:hypothetical protein